MSQKHLAGLTCTKCKKLNYRSTRNTKQVPDKLKMKKFCKTCRVNTEHKETKVAHG
jgi:large subunit ribosomal protein L33